MLAELGLVDEVIRRGLVEPLFRIWDRQSRQVVAQFDFGNLKDETPYPFAVQCEQHKLANMTIERLRAFPHATVEFSARVTALTQSANGVEIDVETAGGTRKVAGSYLIGADGGRSSVRKALGIEFEGYTHPERFLILTTSFDIGTMYPGCTRNYLSDPDDWFSLFKVSGDESGPLWRVLSSTRIEQTDAELLNTEATEARLQKFLPKDGPYPIVHRNLYNVHQRVAASFRQGRAFLAGDAAHVNNPLGGLGLNFGIHDAVELSGLLGRVIRKQAPAEILDIYDRHRRPLNIEFVQQQTIANKKRLEEKDPAARARDFDQLRRTAADPAAHRAYVRRASLLESVRQRAMVEA
jgi:3-(3-hydroxy-phenyl)propionate hydroxylase